jgi:CBS domain-containing protein
MICPACEFNNLAGAEECEQCGQDLTQLDRPMPHDRIELHLMEEAVGSLTLRPLISVRPETPVRQAIATMLDHDLGAVLVVGKDGQLLGIFSERDLLTKVAGLREDLDDARIEEFMTPDPETVSSEDKLVFAAHKMSSGGYRHVPVLTRGYPSGVVSVRDMLRYITHLCRER